MTSVAAPATRIPFFRMDVDDAARAAADRVLASGWVTTGREAMEFEREFAAWSGARHALAVSSCTAALELALRALRLRPGARVLTSAMTFAGAVHAIVHAGHRPVLVDIDPETLMPTAETTAAAARRAGGADAMVVLHFGGAPAPVAALAEAAGLPLSRVIEDAAHAIGTHVGTTPVGTVSAATCFSFYATKNLPIGEGGMVTTDDGDLADHVACARLHGMSRDAWQRYLPGASWRYDIEVDGIKANMTDLMAAIGRVQLDRVSGWQVRRQAIAERYSARLAQVPGLALPSMDVAGRHAWHLYVVRVLPEFGPHRDNVISELAQRGVDCSVHFIPIHHHSHFRATCVGDGESFPGADAAFDGILSLPIYPGLDDDAVDRVCDELERARCLEAGTGGRLSRGTGGTWGERDS